ncbi:MAG: T9SS type A sorting domain-containing protein [Flavobacteriales bacterium]|nr:T9SS type A sorting domain-containing protein [Flavobacteriales bacterium]
MKLLILIFVVATSIGSMFSQNKKRDFVESIRFSELPDTSLMFDFNYGSESTFEVVIGEDYVFNDKLMSEDFRSGTQGYFMKTGQTNVWSIIDTVKSNVTYQSQYQKIDLIYQGSRVKDIDSYITVMKKDGKDNEDFFFAITHFFELDGKAILVKQIQVSLLSGFIGVQKYYSTSKELELLTNDSETELFVYPNPSKGDNFTVVSDEEFNQIEIFDMQGNLVEVLNVLNRRVCSVELTERFSPGMYTLIITNSRLGKRSTCKLVIEE